MTLFEWCKRHRKQVHGGEIGATYVFADSADSRECILDLYSLSDYAVSSRSGPVAWLRRKSECVESAVIPARMA